MGSPRRQSRHIMKQPPPPNSPLLRVERCLLARDLFKHTEVDRSRGGKKRKDRFSLSGGVRTEDMFHSFSLCLKHGRVTQGAEVSSEHAQNFLRMTGESQQFLELGQSLAS